VHWESSVSAQHPEIIKQSAQNFINCMLSWPILHPAYEKSATKPLTRKSSVDEAGRHYRLNHAIVVKLYNSYTQSPHNVHLSHQQIATFSVNGN